MTISQHPDVTVYSSVTEENGVEAGPSVTIWTGSTAGSQGYLVLMTSGLFLLMTSGGLLLV